MNLQRAACEQLAAAIATAVPALAGKVRGAPAEAEDLASYPFLAILPAGKLEFHPFQEDEVDTSDYTDKAVVNIGALEGKLEMRLLTHTSYEREELGQQVLDAFMQDEGAQGRIVVSVPNVVVGGVTTGYGALATFLLESEEWREELAFSKKKFTFFEVSAHIPVLLLKQGAYDITQFVLALSSDVTSTVPPTPAIDEEILIASDGSYTPTTI